MTQEEKSLLLKDLSARLPYYPKCEMIDNLRVINNEPNPSYTECLFPRHLEIFYFHNNFTIKPYLRPMSSMTEKEKGELWFLLTEGRTNIELNSNGQLTTRENIELGLNYPFVCPEGSTLYVDWLNAHHFDYRGLIEKDLAVEAPEGMYSLKGK